MAYVLLSKPPSPAATDGETMVLESTSRAAVDPVEPAASGRFDSLHDAVRRLEIQAEETKKRPWHRRPETLISFAALLLSAMTAYFSATSQNARDVLAKRAALRQLLTEVISVRQDGDAAKLAAIEDVQARTNAAELLNTKRYIALADAADMIAQLGDNVPSSAYLVLAYERRMDSNFKEAESYLLRAIETSVSPQEKAFALREAGAFYLTAGPLRDVLKGQQYFSAAADSFGKETDSYSKYQHALTYERWGIMELAAGDASGLAIVDRARRLYEKLPDGDRTRAWALDALEKNSAQAMQWGGLAPVKP